MLALDEGYSIEVGFLHERENELRLKMFCPLRVVMWTVSLHTGFLLFFARKLRKLRTRDFTTLVFTYRKAVYF